MFENCFSLGWSCDTACSLSRLGLRSEAGPFDWLVSDLPAVLSQIENGFADFMNRGDLEQIASCPGHFVDKKYGFKSVHDIKRSYEDEIDAVIEGYRRRAAGFLQKSTRPTVFFRCIKDNDEARFINENYSCAEQVVKRLNEKNQIVYVLYAKMDPLTDKVLSFRLPVEQTFGKILEMRYLFDQSEELSGFCRKRIPEEKRRKNREYDISKNLVNEMEAVRIKYLYREDAEKMKCMERALNDCRNGVYPEKTDPETVELIRRLTAENYRSLLRWDQ